jgi:hypothetical protein
MPFHLLAYGAASVANTMTNLAGLVDQVMTRAQTSNAYLLPVKMQLMCAVGMGATLSRIQVTSPTLRQVNVLNIRPPIPALQPASGSLVHWLGEQPLMLPALEEIQPAALDTAAERVTFLMWVADQLLPVPPGPIMTIRATSTTAAVANTWTLLAMTLDNALPAGQYALVGSQVISTTGIAHRFQIPGQLLRPGVMSHQLLSDIQDFRLATRRLGAYGNFVQTALPQCEVLCTAADASHEIYLDIVPLNFNLVI